MQLREDVVEMFLFHFLEEYSQRPAERAGDRTEGDRSELLSRCHGGMVPPDRAWPVSAVPGAWLSLAGTGLLGTCGLPLLGELGLWMLVRSAPQGSQTRGHCLTPEVLMV